jgi:phosphatidylglycerol:prolipoprotein diacylglycerol transferase
MMPLIHLGPFWLPAYGLMMSIAVLSGVKLAVYRAGNHGLYPRFVYYAGSLAALTALVMARLLHVAIDPVAYWRSLEPLVTEAGTFLFGFLSALCLICFIAVRRGVSLWALADCFAPSLALGVCLARIGCFLSGCNYGKPTGLAWGVAFTNPLAAQLAGTPLGIRLHPTQLYESLLGLITFFVLIFLSRRGRRSGALILTFISFYAVGRFFIEFFRGDLDRLFWGPFSTSQWLSVALLLLVFVLYRLPSTHGVSAQQIASIVQVQPLRPFNNSR